MANETKHGGWDGWWDARSLAEKIVLGILFGIAGLGLAFLFGWVVMLLWNWLMPEIFGLRRIGYWQAWGLLVLSGILFGRHGSSGSGGSRDAKRKRELRRLVRDEEAGRQAEPAENADAGEKA